MKTPPIITVVGSLNIDLVATVERLPTPGETVAASRLLKLFGGKGANQAVAAARHGAAVRMIGCVGGDADGVAYRARLESFGIDVSGVATVAKSLTGTALIGVAASAENLIMVAPEANGKLTPSSVKTQRKLIQSSQALLLQAEVPLPSVVVAIRLANAAKVPVIFNPSPVPVGFPWSEVWVDVVLVNDSEARSVLGLNPTTLDSQTSQWRRKLQSFDIGTLVVTLGSEPTRFLTQEHLISVPTLPVQPVDTVGAGDCFAGVFATALAGGEPISRAILQANAAAALSTLKPGAQEAVPRRQETLRAVKSLVLP